MTRVLLINAAPTPWEDDDRIVGDQSLPLTESARQAIQEAIDAMPVEPKIEAVYRAKSIECCDEATKMLAARFGLRARESDELRPPNLGLWQGLRKTEARARFPKAFAQWEKNPLSVNPPDGESLADAVKRLRSAVQRILKRNRGHAVALVLRPMAFGIVQRLLNGQPLDGTPAAALAVAPMVENVQLHDPAVAAFLS